MLLKTYFTDSHLIRLLCSYRAELAKKRHDQQFLYNISTSATKPGDAENEEDAFLCSLMPPRKSWMRPNYKDRRNRSSVQTNLLAIERTINQKRASAKYRQENWLINLNEFIETIRNNALENPNLQFQNPQILPIRKEPKSKNHEYRAIAQYQLLDKIICGQCAKYLMNFFDKYFLDCSYAFRKNKLNHHQAIKDLIEYRRKYDSQSIWVAECDIKGFFDCVHHEQARQAFNEARKRAERNGTAVDERAMDIFELYLQSYSFTKVAIPQANEWFQTNDKQGHLKQIDKFLKQFWDNPLDEFLGIPQGGALSCLIANLMLDRADQEVMNNELQLEEQNLFYARYCDDMILVHPEQEICESAFNRYLEALKNLKLAIHEPKPVLTYDRDYWHSKSKLPYFWADKQHIAAVPWVAFVGYQVRYDGLVRIRPSSIEKELKKQVLEADKVLKLVYCHEKKLCDEQNAFPGNGSNHSIRKSKRQIRYRLHKRLIYMSVGRVTINLQSNDSRRLCWSSGFQVLKENRCVKSQLRQLDRNREKQIRRVSRRIEGLNVSSDSDHRKHNRHYFGKPFSYDGQFSSKGLDETSGGSLEIE
jgi:hypothetical protein